MNKMLANMCQKNNHQKSLQTSVWDISRPHDSTYLFHWLQVWRQTYKQYTSDGSASAATHAYTQHYHKKLEHIRFFV